MAAFVLLWCPRVQPKTVWTALAALVFHEALVPALFTNVLQLALAVVPTVACVDMTFGGGLELGTTDVGVLALTSGMLMAGKNFKNIPSN